MPDFFVEGNVPKATDSPTTSLKKINDLLLKPIVPGFNLPDYDQIFADYYAGTNKFQTVTYRKNDAVVAVIEIAYADDPVTNDSLFVSATRTS